jgi:ribose 5-phosphate isomerase
LAASGQSSCSLEELIVATNAALFVLIADQSRD